VKRYLHIYVLCAVLTMPFCAFAQDPRNECVDYYEDDGPRDTGHCTFRKIVETEYYSEDSLGKGKTSISSTVHLFNKIGEEVSKVTMNSDSMVTDSAISIYNAFYNLLYDAEWKMDDDDSELNNTRQEWYTYDAKGYDIMDSGHRNDFGAMRYWLSRYKYDDKGNKTEEITYAHYKEREADTTICHETWDDQGRLILEELIKADGVTRYYYRFNKWGYEIFRAVVQGKNDSDYTNTIYDSAGHFVSYSEYEFGRLKMARSVTRNKGHGWVETLEEGSTAGEMACANNSVTVTVHDSLGNELTKVINSEKDGYPDVVTTIHYLSYDRNGNVLRDSSSSAEKGYLYYETWQGIETYRYNKANLRTDDIKENGNDYQKYSRFMSSYNRKNNLLHSKSFSSCNIPGAEPDEEKIMTYYGNGKTVKTYADKESIGSFTKEYYGRDGRTLKKFEIEPSSVYDDDGMVKDGYKITEYTYQK